MNNKTPQPPTNTSGALVDALEYIEKNEVKEERKFIYYNEKEIGKVKSKR